MRNLLNRRIPRELKKDIGKYIALFLFLMITIGFVSGFLVADGSMVGTYNNSFEKYNIEDGHFTLASPANATLKDKLEDKDITLYEMFYKDIKFSENKTIRVYKNRSDVNKICLMKGAMSKTDSEIVIDRLYAAKNNVKIGDTMSFEGKDFKVSGYVALSDYSALFKSNTDMMFDAKNFTVAIVSDSAYDSLSTDEEKFCYSWTLNDKTLTKQQQSDKADDIMDVLKGGTIITDFVKRADNQATQFTGTDMGQDKAMMTWLLYIVVVVLAFVFAVTTKSTIEQEASVIGTLRASGYTRRELMCHYLALPIIVTLVAAILGNVIGYTFMKDYCVSMYYNSYSLPTYVTLWNSEAFIKTTLIPCLIIFLVNLLVLWRSLSLSPLQFLRHELSHSHKKKVAKLPNFKFLTRFRIRIILQNLPAYITLFVGILLASVLLVFGMIFPPLLENFKGEIVKSQFADYQYILKMPAKTTVADAEKYCVTSLDIPGGEEMTVYGIKDNSEHLKSLKLSTDKDSVIASDGFLEKYGKKVGDTITLDKKFSDKKYTFKIAGEYHYAAALSIFMPQDDFNYTFGNDKDYFNGYFSNEKLTDIDKAYIASTFTSDDLMTVAKQLDDSLGFMYPLVTAFSVILYTLLMYLLAKLIVEKNAQSISMIKILGYSSREAGKLYNSATAIVVLISLIISLPLSCYIMKLLYYTFMQEINGWMTFTIAPWIYPAMLGMGIVCYLLVHLLQMNKIRKIPMSDALKNME